MMKSYSKVFKASNLSVLEEVKVISQPAVPMMLHLVDENEDPSQALEELTVPSAISDANLEAQAIMERAEVEAQMLKNHAAEEIDQWWEENRQRLEIMTDEAKQQGFQEGFLYGKQEAKLEVEREYQDKMMQVQQVLQSAYEQKEAIISEAEPFLLELSTAIASKIVKQELDTDPEKFVELIQQHILRFKEKEFITVCVHPDDFDFIQSQRGHLVAVVNGETEIKIIPDHSVTAKGCVIRTAYGSVDARIDTQIEEIKRVILEARREPESATIS